MASSPDRSPAPRSRRGTNRISPSAVLGTLFLLASAIALGVLGPRMGQRGVRMSGTPLSEVQFVLVDRFRASLGSSPGEPITSEIAPDLSDLGFELVGERELDLFDRAVRIDRYRGSARAAPLEIVRLGSPRSLIRFDPLGRQLPLLPGVRIEDAVEIGIGELQVGMVVLGLEDEAVIVLGIGLEEVRRVADELVPPSEELPAFDSLVRGTILESPTGPMNIG
ncbi:MAG: hypothetical protein VX672_05145 [Planctomycetota bacterium]|nr:hypothetical protein [Planctomycetota bacterium]